MKKLTNRQFYLRLLLFMWVSVLLVGAVEVPALRANTEKDISALTYEIRDVYKEMHYRDDICYRNEF